MAKMAGRWKSFLKLLNDEDPNGFLGTVLKDQAATDVVSVRWRPAYHFKTGRVVVFLDPITGLKQAGPVRIETYDRGGARLKVSCKVTVSDGDAIYEDRFQTECGPPKV